MSWKAMFKTELKEIKESHKNYRLSNAVESYRQSVADAEEFGYAADKEFQEALAWFHSEVASFLEVPRDRFLLLEKMEGESQWDHERTKCGIFIYRDKEEVFVHGPSHNFETSRDGVTPETPEWQPMPEEFWLPENIESFPRTVQPGGSFHESWFFSGYWIPSWLGQIIIENNK